MDGPRVWMELLAAQGYTPCLEALDEYPEIRFRADGRQYRIVTDRADPHFFGMVLGAGVPERLRAPLRLLEAANHMNDLWKVAKTIVHPDGSAVRFQFEALVCASGPTAELLGRALASLHAIADRFFAELDPGASALRC